jgi:hypothetical protein
MFAAEKQEDKNYEKNIFSMGYELLIHRLSAST